MEISRVGLGTWAQGGGGFLFSWGRQDDRESAAAIRRAVELGTNWVDTAPAYGHGHAEEVVGSVMASIPEADRPYVFTKAGRRWDETDPMAPLYTDLSPASVHKEVEGSLRRLRTERIDLLQVHWPPTDGARAEEYWSSFVSLRDQGKVRAVGVSNHDLAALEQAEVIGHVDSLQPPFSLIRREAAGAEIPWCAEHGTGVIAYAPLQAGLLTGAMTAERVASMPEDDWRRRNAEFVGERLQRNLSLAERLGTVAQRHGASTAAVAVAWVLAWPGVTGAIVGARRPGQLDDWIAAADLSLEDDDLAEIAGALEQTGAGAGPRRPGQGGPRL
jgi:aryl-alcohol dehydrogenase-like predicted oxidoreductase